MIALPRGAWVWLACGVTDLRYFPHIAAAVSRQFPGPVLRAERVLGDAEKCEDLALERHECRIEGLDEVVVASKRVALGVAEQAEDLLGGRALAGLGVGVEGVGVEALAGSLRVEAHVR